MKIRFLCLFLLFSLFAYSQSENINKDPFKQLGTDLPTPNSYRTASGKPGHQYWQQKADYDIDLTLDDENQKILASETITYHNNSPDQLEYLWLQLDQNMRAKDSDSYKIRSSSIGERGVSENQIKRLENPFDGGFNIEKVTDENGKPLEYHIEKTMMRINLPKPLDSKSIFNFNIDWWYNINNHRTDGGRSGYEHFSEDGNNVYVIAQFFPRMCVYSDIDGWQNKQFLGRGEFALVFGDYKVDITVPSDHLVASTGTLQNESKVLSKTQIKRLREAENEFEQPVIIATQDEAEDRMKSKSTKTQTWSFHAENVRDFAFASSRRFIWDAMGVKMSDGKVVKAMSMYVKEGNPLWERYSTKAVAHTVKWYSHYTFDYPYPVAWSIDGSMGMEYPMICFNFGRCEEDGTYTERTKYGHIGVIIHEVGHNWFPMIVNSDERQWTWMDEGINSFVQYLTEQHWERDYPSRRGPAYKITSYMDNDKKFLTPIMTNSESIYEFGNNAYGKPATAMNILRETIMGREAFDYAFKTYANRWKFKHPSPADLFRTMEDASGIDLDWFWRGWFYTTDHCDMAIDNVKWFKVDPKNPEVVKLQQKEIRDAQPEYISDIRNKKEIEQTYSEVDESIVDFYSTYDPLEVDEIDKQEYQRYLDQVNPEMKDIISDKKKNYYELSFERKGGLIMPIILQFQYIDGTTEDIRIPAEIWKLKPDNKVTKVFPTEKEIEKIILDPYMETADINTQDNYYPPKPEDPSRFEVFQQRTRSQRENPMQRANRAKKIIKP